MSRCWRHRSFVADRDQNAAENLRLAFWSWLQDRERPAHLEAPHAYKYGQAYDTPGWTASSPYTDPDVIDTIGVDGIDAIAAHFGGVWPKLAPTATAASAARPRATAAAASAPSAAQLPRKRSPPAISGAPRGPRDSRTSPAAPSFRGTAGSPPLLCRRVCAPLCWVFLVGAVVWVIRPHPNCTPGS